MYQMLRDSIGHLGDDPGVTRQQAAAAPFASIGLRVGDSTQVLLVLATKSRDTCLWTSSAHVALETQEGRITRTAGLPHDMTQSLFGGSDPLQQPAAQDAGYEYVIDVPDRDIYQAPVHYSMAAPEPDKIVIFGATLKVLHLREHGSCPVLDWEFDNDYWADSKSGFVWRSQQNIHPDLDTVEIVVFRPAA